MNKRKWGKGDGMGAKRNLPTYLEFPEGADICFVILPLKTLGIEKTKRHLAWFLRDIPMLSTFGSFLATGKK